MCQRWVPYPAQLQLWFLQTKCTYCVSGFLPQTTKLAISCSIKAVGWSLQAPELHSNCVTSELPSFPMAVNIMTMKKRDSDFCGPIRCLLQCKIWFKIFHVFFATVWGILTIKICKYFYVTSSVNLWSVYCVVNVRFCLLFFVGDKVLSHPDWVIRIFRGLGLRDAFWILYC